MADGKDTGVFEECVRGPSESAHDSSFGAASRLELRLSYQCRVGLLLTAGQLVDWQSLRATRKPAKERGSHMIREREISILTVDDHPLFREALRAVIASQPDMLLVAEAASGAEAFEQFREHRPDITLMDIRLPDSSGIEAMVAIRSRFPEGRMILVSTYQDDLEIRSALLAGADGHILKTMHPRELVSTIRKVYAGRRWVPPPTSDDFTAEGSGSELTSREVEVLARVAGGKRTHEIAQLLFVTENAVKDHLKQAMRKLGARDQTKALNIAARRGFIRL